MKLDNAYLEATEEVPPPGWGGGGDDDVVQTAQCILWIRGVHVSQHQAGLDADPGRN